MVNENEGGGAGVLESILSMLRKAEDIMRSHTTTIELLSKRVEELEAAAVTDDPNVAP